MVKMKIETEAYNPVQSKMLLRITFSRALKKYVNHDTP